MDKPNLIELLPVFRYPPLILEFNFSMPSLVTDSQFKELVSKVNAERVPLDEHLHEKLEDVWYSRILMLLSQSNPADLIKNEMHAAELSERISHLIDWYVSDAETPSQRFRSDKEVSLCCMFVAVMNLLSVETNLTSLRPITANIRKLVKDRKYLLNSLIRSLALGVLTNYVFNLVQGGAKSDLEELLPDIIGAGINCLRFDINRDHRQAPTQVPFAGRDFSVSLALLRNAFALPNPPILFAHLISNKSIAENFRLIQNHRSLLDLLVSYLAQVLTRTPDRHAVHCLFNMVHSEEWSNLERELQERANLILCINKLEELVAHEELDRSLQLVGTMCLWTLRVKEISAEDFVAWLKGVMVVHEHGDGRAVRMALATLNSSLGRSKTSWSLQECIQHSFANVETFISTETMLRPDNKEIATEVLNKMRNIVDPETFSLDNPTENANVSLLHGKDDENDRKPIFPFVPHKSSSDLGSAGDSPFVYAREHAIMITEVESIPLFSTPWEQHIFKPSGYDVIYVDRLRVAEAKGELLVGFKAFVKGIYPRPHWPMREMEETSVAKDVPGVLLHNWKMNCPFDAFVFISNGKDMLICNHHRREIHLFMRFSPNTKKTN